MRLRSFLAFGIAALALLTAGAAAHATLITFDERPYAPVIPDDTSFNADPITTEYDHLGVAFDFAYLRPAFTDPDYPTQYALGAHGFSISFTDAVLPTFVSLVFGSPLQDFRATVTALDASGNVVGSAHTGGAYIASDTEPFWGYTPYDPTTHGNFHSDGGIARLVFGVETGPRLEARFDNLYFGNVAAVPEPATYALWAAGLAVLLAARRKRQLLAVLLALSACLAAPAARATLITFDERPYSPEIPGDYTFSADEIGTYYAQLGVDLGLAWLRPAFHDPDYRSQWALGAWGYNIRFTDAVLPTYVSLVFGSPLQDFRSTVTAFDAAGNIVGFASTGGSYIADFDPPRWDRTPYDPTTHGSFHSASGIAMLVFETETHPRAEARFDNLYFGNVPAVPEPATVAMWAAGLGVMATVARQRKKKS